MTLLDRYLRAVAAQLPKASREDIVAELRDLLLNRFEAKEEELGRPLTDAEQEAILREFGHPLSVAGRYGAGPGHVVGPELYPYWLFAVKVGLVAVVGFTVLATVFQLAFGGLDISQAFGRIISNSVQGGIALVGVATIAGFILERHPERPAFLKEWRVQDLHLFELGALDTEALERQFKGAQADGPRKHRHVRIDTGSPAANALAGAMAFTVLLLWWTGLLPIADLRPGAGSWVFDGVDYGAILTSIVEVAFWPILAYLGCRIALELYRAWRPRARRSIALGQLALAGARLAGLLWLWNVSALSPVIRVDTVQAFIDRVQALPFNWFDPPTLLMILVIFNMIEAVGTGLKSLWRLATPSRREAVA